jgi:hypothetical protein
LSSEETIAPLAPVEKLRLAGEIVSTYARMRWAMRREDLEGIVSRLRAARPAEIEQPAPAICRRLSGAVMGVLSMVPTDSRGLVRSLVYLALLERRGIDGTLVIGVRTEPEFAAHAWVELDGDPQLPWGNGEYTPLTVI